MLLSQIPHTFRDYADVSNERNDTVRETYRKNHVAQTYETAKFLRENLVLQYGKKGVWEMLELLNGIIDESDPDTGNTQIQHALQAAQSARKDNQPRWMQLVCLIHDMGKVLNLAPYKFPQEMIVGDTFPLGCAFSEKIVHADLFAANADLENPLYNSKYGVYEANCGLDQVVISYGHDEYLYRVVKPHLPEIASLVIRYHSLYVVHKEHEYGHLMNEKDYQVFEWVRIFNKYDLYSKKDELVDEKDSEIRGYYQELIREFFPKEIDF